tara:strand:- start:20 stop:892 length:873 start_codon:yes stop_codon:yes gene_type:complete
MFGCQLLKRLIIIGFVLNASFCFALGAKSHRHSAFPENDLWVPSSSHFAAVDEWNNGYEEAAYHQVLDAFYQLYAPRIELLGGVFIIERDWTDGAVNAFSWKGGNQFGIEIPGGISRYELMNEEAFILVICHEMGHILGGAPHREGTSFEGQSDYFSSLKCMREMLPLLPRPQVIVGGDCMKAFGQDEGGRQGAELQSCQNTFRGALALTSLYARVEGSPFPKPETPDTKKVSRSSHKHPKAQCRLDTILAGMLCPVAVDQAVSEANPATGTCMRPEYEREARPRCWYRP